MVSPPHFTNFRLKAELRTSLRERSLVVGETRIYIWATGPPRSLLVVLSMHFFLDTQKASATMRANTRKEVIQSNDKNKFGLAFDEKSSKKLSSKSKLEEVFIKKQHSFKVPKDFKRDSVFNKRSSFEVSNDSKKDSVFNKNFFKNYSNDSLNNRDSLPRRLDSRFQNKSFNKILIERKSVV